MLLSFQWRIDYCRLSLSWLLPLTRHITLDLSAWQKGCFCAVQVWNQSVSTLSGENRHCGESGMKKLLLVYPNQRWLKTDVNTTWNLNPDTLCLLGAMVRGMVEVKILDAQFYDFSCATFIDEVAAYGPDFAGISILSSEYGATLDIAAEMIKRLKPATVVIAGGIHPTVEYAAVIASPYVDYVVRGEGEHVLVELIEFLLGNGPLPAVGLVYRRSGAVIVQEQAVVRELDRLPWPDYSLVRFEDYSQVGPRVGPLRPLAYPYMRLSVTRGCPFGCSFCQVAAINGKTVRVRDPLDVVRHLLECKDRFGIRSLQFDDDNIVANRTFFKQLLETMIEKELDLPFVIGAFAIFLLADDLLDLMVAAGCKGINVAIESGSNRVLMDIVQKPVNLRTVPAQIARVKDRGLFVLANFIIGYPGETWDEIRETINYAGTCGADYVKLFVAVPLKNTKLWDMALRLDAFTGDPSGIAVEWRFSQIKSNEWTAKDISILRAYEWDRLNFDTAEKRQRVAAIWGISGEELGRIRKETRDAIVF